MGMVGKNGHRKAGRDNGIGSQGKNLLRVVLELSLSAGALLILIMTMCGTTEWTRPDDASPLVGTERSSGDWAPPRVARLTPGHAIVSDPPAIPGKREGAAMGASTSAASNNVWQVEGSAEQENERIRQVVMNSAQPAEKRDAAPLQGAKPAGGERASLPPVPGALWVLAAGILGLLGIHRKFLP
jgi:hypothetical protein